MLAGTKFRSEKTSEITQCDSDSSSTSAHSHRAYRAPSPNATSAAVLGAIGHSGGHLGAPEDTGHCGAREHIGCFPTALPRGTETADDSAGTLRDTRHVRHRGLQGAPGTRSRGSAVGTQQSERTRLGGSERPGQPAGSGGEWSSASLMRAGQTPTPARPPPSRCPARPAPPGRVPALP